VYGLVLLITKSSLLEPAVGTVQQLAAIEAVLKQQLRDLPSAAVGRSLQEQTHRRHAGHWVWLATLWRGNRQPLPCPGPLCMPKRTAAPLLLAAELQFNFPLSTSPAV